MDTSTGRFKQQMQSDSQLEKWHLYLWFLLNFSETLGNRQPVSSHYFLTASTISLHKGQPVAVSSRWARQVVYAWFHFFLWRFQHAEMSRVYAGWPFQVNFGKDVICVSRTDSPSCGAFRKTVNFNRLLVLHRSLRSSANAKILFFNIFNVIFS